MTSLSPALAAARAWALIRDFGDPADEDRQLRDRLDHVMAAGFDFASTEMGFSEFTKPDDRKMLHWLDLFAEHLETRWGKHGLTKAHVSAGQTAPNFVDPDTGGPLNFNFLTHYAHPRLGVMPHTVQHYALDDPAPTYGNDDFAFMREFLAEAGAPSPEAARSCSSPAPVPSPAAPAPSAGTSAARRAGRQGPALLVAVMLCVGL